MANIHGCACCLKIIDFTKEVDLSVLPCGHIRHTKKCEREVNQKFCAVCWKLFFGPSKRLFISVDFECSICLEPVYKIEPKQTIALLNCGHVYHRHCISGIEVSLNFFSSIYFFVNFFSLL